MSLISAVPKSLLGSLLRGLAWVCFGVAGLSFWWGGRAISEFGHEDRFLAEFEGIGFGVVCGGLGFVAKGAGERLVDTDDEAKHSSEE